MHCTYSGLYCIKAIRQIITGGYMEKVQENYSRHENKFPGFFCDITVTLVYSKTPWVRQMANYLVFNNNDNNSGNFY